MPGYLKNGSVFLHVPKTGGEWVTAVLDHVGLLDKEYGHKHADYWRSIEAGRGLNAREQLKYCARLVGQRALAKAGVGSSGVRDAGNRFSFMFVRHPLGWYESWWKYMNGRNWHAWGAEASDTDWHPNAVLNDLADPDFNSFVRRVIHKRPGYVSELYFAYAQYGISFIGKTERLAEHLILALEKQGLEVNGQKVREFSKTNVSKTDANLVQWDPAVRELAMRVEIPALIHFGYLTDKEASDLGVPAGLPVHPALFKAP